MLAIESAGGTNWVLQDHLGSTRALVSSAGVLVQSIDYDSFGKAIIAGSPSTRYLYTGRELDAESGLFYYRARYYDSSTGRFTNEDPIRFFGMSFNLQEYVRNSPVSLDDPMGLMPACPPSRPQSVPGGWVVYPGYSSVFHCGYFGIVQAVCPDPKGPGQNECFYDGEDKLVDDDHPYSGCKGTPNQYENSDGFWSEANWNHTKTDVLRDGPEAIAETGNKIIDDAIGDIKNWF